MRYPNGSIAGDEKIAQLFGYDSRRSMQEAIRKLRRRYPLPAARGGADFEMPTVHGGPAGPGNPHYFANEHAALVWYHNNLENFRERVDNMGRHYTPKPYARRKRPRS